MTSALHPTPDAQLNAVLHELVISARQVLAGNFFAAYLVGSFAAGGWDRGSDVDFLIVIERDIPETLLPELNVMHARIYGLDSEWAKHLEGSYYPRAVLRRWEPDTPPLYLDNGSRELVRSQHDNTRVARWTLREHGIPLAGPDPRELVDPIPPDELKQEVLTTMHTWAQDIFSDPQQMNNGWYQPYAVLSYNRMLHTLHTGRIESKFAAAQWAQRALDPRWTDLIRRAWEAHPGQFSRTGQKADPDHFEATLRFIHYILDESRNVFPARS